MNCFAGALQIAGTVRTHWISSSKISVADWSDSSSKTWSLKNFRVCANTSTALTVFPLAALISVSLLRSCGAKSKHAEYIKMDTHQLVEWTTKYSTLYTMKEAELSTVIAKVSYQPQSFTHLKISDTAPAPEDWEQQAIMSHCPIRSKRPWERGCYYVCSRWPLNFCIFHVPGCAQKAVHMHELFRGRSSNHWL